MVCRLSDEREDTLADSGQRGNRVTEISAPGFIIYGSIQCERLVFLLQAALPFVLRDDVCFRAAFALNNQQQFLCGPRSADRFQPVGDDALYGSPVHLSHVGTEQVLRHQENP
ncbi:hypothetical protein DKP76_13350 [Falsochrobactrum shanghaiense]|uniref:Uncharacterized protein n=1 Tax=Falsochrobactrum shanghaiense TaxID=2201899 RepID=A0A316J512_9HYPH|nr:hypothetical protein DKP76_13350 [Falsochrobactrum shanghaiense]